MWFGSVCRPGRARPGWAGPGQAGPGPAGLIVPCLQASSLMHRRCIKPEAWRHGTMRVGMRIGRNSHALQLRGARWIIDISLVSFDLVRAPEPYSRTDATNLRTLLSHDG